MSGLKINFDKSEVVVMGVTVEEQQRIACNLNCKVGKFPIYYLGLLLSDSRITTADWGFFTTRVGTRVDPWQGKHHSSADMLVLLNACLTSLVIFSMSLFLLGIGRAHV